MAAPEPGSIVLVRFPFSDPSRVKLRPAAVLADARAIKLEDASFAAGSFRVTN